MHPDYAQQGEDTAPSENDPGRMRDELVKRREMASDSARYHRGEAEKAETVAGACEAALERVEAYLNQPQEASIPSVYR